jgi:hypothetical protein
MEAFFWLMVMMMMVMQRLQIIRSKVAFSLQCCALNKAMPKRRELALEEEALVIMTNPSAPQQEIIELS